MLRPYKRRLKRWLLTKHLRSQVREPAALPQKSCPKHETAPLLQCHFHQPSHSARVRRSRTPRAHGTHRLSRKSRSRSRELHSQQQPVRGNGRHDRDDDEGGTSHVLPTNYLKSSNQTMQIMQIFGRRCRRSRSRTRCRRPLRASPG